MKAQISQNLLLGALLVVLLMASCKKDRNETVNEDSGNFISKYDDGTRMKDLQVPDGFDFNFSQKVQFDLRFKDQDGNKATSVKYDIIGISERGESQKLSSGSSTKTDQMQIDLDIPNHFEKVAIKTEFLNTTRYFEYLVDDLIRGDLTVNGLPNAQVQQRSGNCYPSTVINYNVDNKGFQLNSDQTMTTVEVHYTDGTKEIVTVNSTSLTF